jgi:hypothetical protein
MGKLAKFPTRGSGILAASKQGFDFIVVAQE